MTVGGRTFRVACAAGEEDRVARLGAAVDAKLKSMGNLTGHEAQNLLFAALLLADEVHEGRDTVARADGEIAAAKAQAGAAVGEIEELKATLANRDAEIEQLQSTARDTQHGFDEAQNRLAELTERIAERQANESALHQQIEALQAERAGDEANAREQAPSVTQADLAPALERLAEMLEETADKLERGGQAS